jgi:ABC-2 type transport system ATP-binding protein
MIEVQNISKSYRKKLAVDDVSFSVKTGRVTGFLGPNGAGKSTTMRLMVGLDGGKGNTLFDGRPLHSYANASTIVGLMLEAKAFHPTRSARNHLQVLADASGLKKYRVDEVLTIVGLHDVAKKAPGKFSLGMSQRLGIAAAILNEPKHLILDEPANGLDPEGIAWLRNFIKEYADKGNSVLVSSHLLSEIAQMADDVVVIGKGRLIAETSMHDLLVKNTRTGVFVRTKDTKKLELLLKRKKMAYDMLDAGVKIIGSNTDEVGTMLFSEGLAVLELRTHEASLEEAFLDLTADSQEYKSQSKKSRKDVV